MTWTHQCVQSTRSVGRNKSGEEEGERRGFGEHWREVSQFDAKVVSADVAILAAGGMPGDGRQRPEELNGNKEEKNKRFENVGQNLIYSMSLTKMVPTYRFSQY